MRVGAFELRDPLPELREPIAFAMLSPWIDVGRVGTSTVSALETHFDAQELGRLRRPGFFYDFTRYRPILYRAEGRREVEIPNTIINHARRPDGTAVLFLHCLEPHSCGELYAESVLKVLERLGVKRYCTIGAMYDSVPHTRPLLITGSASTKERERELRALRVTDSGYQGPTTINILVAEGAQQRGIETQTLVVHLPHYAQLDEDFNGTYTLLRLICSLYNFPLDLGSLKRKGDEQYKRVGLAVGADPKIGDMIRAMEMSYDSRLSKEQGEAAEAAELSPEIQEFLGEMDKRFGTN